MTFSDAKFTFEYGAPLPKSGKCQFSGRQAEVVVGVHSLDVAGLRFG